MAVYAIGDLQGCFTELQALLDKIRFQPEQDYLWFVGDLVNRGPDSLACLRFVKALGNRAITVLGNHDLHLLAVATGVRKLKKGDTLEAILQAADRDELLNWLRQQPLLHRDTDLGYTLVHAGLHPAWEISQAVELAREVEESLRGKNHIALLQRIYGNQPSAWSDSLKGYGRKRFVINVFTRMRFCTAAGELDLVTKMPPGQQPAHLLPWFAVPKRKNAAERIVFGHWSALGRMAAHNVIALDTGCVWGKELTAVRLDLAQPVFYSVS